MRKANEAREAEKRAKLEDTDGYDVDTSDKDMIDEEIADPEAEPEVKVEELETMEPEPELKRERRLRWIKAISRGPMAPEDPWLK